LSVGQRRRMAMSRMVSILWNRSNLVGVFYLKDKLLTSPSSSTLNIPCLDLRVTKKTKQQLHDSNCYTSKVFLVKLLCIILDISSPGDNLYMYYNIICARHKGFCPQVEKLYHCASTQKHIIVQSIMNSSYNFGTFAPNCCKCTSGRLVHTFQTVGTIIAQLAHI